MSKKARPKAGGKEPGRPAKGGLDDAAASLLWVWRALRKSWPILIAATLLATGASLLYTKSLPRIYEAQTTLEFDPDVVRPLGDRNDPKAFWAMMTDQQEYYETQFAIMTSDRVLSAVVRDMGLTSSQEFWGFKPDKPMPLDDTVATLRSMVKVDPVKMSRLVQIKVAHTSPQLARSLCDAVARAYIGQNLEKTVSGTSDAVVWLNGQLDHYKRELTSTENDLQEFRKHNELPSTTLDDVSKVARLEMQHYSEALSRTRTRKAELSARNAELSKVTPDNPDQVPASELLTNGFLSSLRTQYQSAVREKREHMAEGRGENHPLVKKSDEKIASTRKDLLEEIKNIQGAVQRDLAILQRQEAGEAALYEAASKRAVDLNLKELEYHRLDRQRAQNEKVYSLLLEQMKQADLARMMNVNNVRIVDAPSEPKVPIRPKVPNNVGIGFAIGLAIGLALVFLREQLDNTVKTPEDLEERLGLTFLGLLPVLDESSTERPGTPKGKRPRRMTNKMVPELVVHERPLSGIAEAARAVRTNLTFMNPDHPHRLILVTSAAPGEGKTTVACSIAISLAQAGLRTCIIDCDFRRPRLHRIFGRAGDAGLTNVLVGDATLDEVSATTVVDNLSCIPSGPIPPNPGDMLHSEKFKGLLVELARRFDRVVVDSPPLAAVSDSAVISTVVDGTVFVVRAGKTSRTLATQGLRALADVDAYLIGSVLNAVDFRKNDYSYYQQYYYYRREGYGPIEGEGPVAQGEDPPGTSASPPN